MLDIGWPEMLVVAIVLIVVVGPKDLPKMLRTFGTTLTKLRSMAGEFRQQFDDVLKEAELDDVKSVIDTARSANPMNEIKKHLSPLEKAGKDIKAGLDAATKPGSSTTSAAPADSAVKEAASADVKAGGEAPAAKKPASKAKTASTKPRARKSAAVGSNVVKKPAAGASAAKPKATTTAGTQKATAKKPAAKKPATARKPAAKKTAGSAS